MKHIISTTAAITLAGCASVADVKLQPISGQISIPEGSAICLIHPGDGQFKDKVYKTSGVKVGEVILKSVPKRYSPKVVGSEEACKSNYLVTSEILEYENRASGWSGKPDKIKVKVTARNMENDELSTFTYYADTNLAASAFFEWGNAAPYELLDSEFSKQVADLLGD